MKSVIFYAGAKTTISEHLVVMGEKIPSTNKKGDLAVEQQPTS